MRICLLKWMDPLMDILKLAFEANGAEVTLIDLEPLKKLSEVVSQIQNFKPNFCLTNNFYIFDQSVLAAPLEDFFHSTKIPLVVFWSESPDFSGSSRLLWRWHHGPFPKNFLFIGTQKESQNFFSKRGLPCAYIPMGVDSRLLDFKPFMPRAHLKTDLCYSGRPFFQQMPYKVQDFREIKEAFIHLIDREFWNELTRAFLTPLHQKLRANWETFVAKEILRLFEDSFLNRRDFAFRLNSFFETLSHDVDPQVQELFHSIYYGRFRYLYSSNQLICYLNELCSRNIRIFGGDLWERILPNYHQSSMFLSNKELLQVFQESKITFCLTKHQFGSQIHDRVFQVLALGGFPLTDRRDDLAANFELDEVATYDSKEELLDKIDYYSTHDEERRKISAKGRERVRACHTYDHRAASILKAVKAYFG